MFIKKKEFKHFASIFSFAAAIIFVTASTCESNSSGSSGNSSTTSYEFESVNLHYNFSQTSPNPLQDAGEFHAAHGIDPTRASGTITNLRDIISRESYYPHNRKPSITITINLASENDGYIEHTCTDSDISSNRVDNIPDCGANISSLIVKIESIITESNQIKMVWSKMFDLNGQWWSSVEDTALSGEADINICGYSKVIGSNLIYQVRKRDRDSYEVVSYIEPAIMTGEVINCDVEFVTSEPPRFPIIGDLPIYRNGERDYSIKWSEPESVKFL